MENTRVISDFRRDVNWAIRFRRMLRNADSWMGPIGKKAEASGFKAYGTYSNHHASRG
jgi:hypothetical protein